MPTIHFKTAMAITGLSRASLWRRIKDHPGSSETLGESKGLLQTRIHLDSALTWAGLTLDEEERTLIPAADAGDAAAQRELGLVFLGLEQPQRAVHWLHLAAAQQDADAMQWLGKLYAGDEGVEQDEAQAMEWIKKAAAQGHLIAQRQVEELGR
ncbi:MAG: sel1 repeat family protein [Lamprobacter sp.]|uniref:sel1 repeat family protein n=1 Tax=Lamprobacter sp. TaxID=3100796 RepID=UPI002B2567A8|nr:sel1 repeat family protein [Lamprobacter sp.]MEA3639663.1 sel1 repeat family protein [Lamprobacter sp.]